jgi:hypothetical protein
MFNNDHEKNIGVVRTVGQDRIARAARPVHQVARGGDARLLAPAATFRLRKRVGLRVVGEVKGAIASTQEIWAIQHHASTAPPRSEGSDP